VSPPRTLI